MDYDDEVSVKDIVNFHIKINNASKAKKALARLSSKDKVAAFTTIDLSQAHRDFKIEVAKYFVYDLDPRVRRKAEVMLETLVPGWGVGSRRKHSGAAQIGRWQGDCQAQCRSQVSLWRH